MKYSTLEYDMNRPSTKVINVPLDSNYGIAVKVFKDGQLIQPSLSVGGEQATGTRADWQLFELSSGSVPCKKLMEVRAAEVISTHLEHTWAEQVENEYEEPDEFNTLLPLSDLFSEDTFRLEASKTQLSGWLDGEQINLYVDKDYDTADAASWILSAEIGKWVYAYDESWTEDYIDVNNTDVIEAIYVLSGGQTAELSVVIETDSSEEGEAVGFKLIVNEKDMSRIETKTTEE